MKQLKGKAILVESGSELHKKISELRNTLSMGELQQWIFDNLTQIDSNSHSIDIK